MKIARYRSKRTFEAVQWNGSNHDQIAEFLGPHHYGILVREESSQFKAPRLLVILVGWGTMNIGVGDYITRKGKEGGPYSVDVSDGERFLMFNEKIDA